MNKCPTTLVTTGYHCTLSSTRNFRNFLKCIIILFTVPISAMWHLCLDNHKITMVVVNNIIARVKNQN